MKIYSICFGLAIASSSLSGFALAASQTTSTAAIVKSLPSKMSEPTQQTIAARRGEPFSNPGKIYGESAV